MEGEQTLHLAAVICRQGREEGQKKVATAGKWIAHGNERRGRRKEGGRRREEKVKLVAEERAKAKRA